MKLRMTVLSALLMITAISAVTVPNVTVTDENGTSINVSELSKNGKTVIIKAIEGT